MPYFGDNWLLTANYVWVSLGLTELPHIVSAFQTLLLCWEQRDENQESNEKLLSLAVVSVVLRMYTVL